MYMTTRLDDEGMAYLYTMIVIFLIVAGVILAFFSTIENSLIVEMNSQIEDGHVSAQTQEYFSLGITLFNGIAGITMLGAIVYVVHEAYKRRTPR